MADTDRDSKTAQREPISELTTGRLSIYLRCLTHLESLSVTTISSQALADRFHLNSAQIRKDLACFGEFGIRGVGYDVSALKRHLIETLGLSRSRGIVIAGAGNLGMALVNYSGFNTGGFQVVALVDQDPAKIGKTSRGGVPILPIVDLPTIVPEHHVEIGIIAVPGEAGQPVFQQMLEAGIRAVLNFSPVQVKKQPGVKVKNVDLRINLESLSFYLKRSEENGTDDDSAD